MRKIEPWALICRKGNWYCIGFDLERMDQRTFKLPRIHGTVRITAEKHSEPRPDHPTMEIPQSEDIVTATITVAAGHGAMLRRNSTRLDQTALGDRIEVRGVLADLVEWTLLALAHVVSIESPALETEVNTAIDALVAGHLAGFTESEPDV
jgi:predicted DNA-binding transcriptional regulator YafY